MIVRLVSITRKEFLHIIRDPRTLAVIFLIPVVQLLLLGYAATTDIKHLRTAVWDQDRTARSRELVEAYRASGYFEMAYYVGSEEELAHAVDSGDARGGLITVTSGVVYQAGTGTSYPYCDTNSADSQSRIHWDGDTFTITAGKETIRCCW